MYLQEVSQSPHDLLNLLGQFSGGGQDQSLAFKLVIVQSLQDAGTKGGSLPSARLGLLDDV